MEQHNPNAEDHARPEAPATAPALSVVVVATDGYTSARKTIRHLKAQTIQDQIEVLLVAESAEALAIDAADKAGFFAFEIVEQNPIGWVDHAQAPAIRRARAGVVALIEDHAYPAPDWAEILLEAHQGPWSAVGAAIANANPGTMLSWANLLLSYGSAGWTDPVAEGHEVENLPNHNVSYKRDVLLAYDDVLEQMLERGSDFHARLKAAGHRFYLVPGRVYHMNPSLLRSVWSLRFEAGRLYGFQRAEQEQWPTWKRVLYAGGAPLIPLVRLRWFKRTMVDEGPYRTLWPQILPATMVGLAADAAGQAFGYVNGLGDALQKLADFEVDRLQHVTEADRRAVLP